MAFPESLKLIVKKKANFSCCICYDKYVEIHHIIPNEDGGPDSEDNAAPLCPSCHEKFGANPTKRKFIRETRDYWYELCEKKYSYNSAQLEEILKSFVPRTEFEELKSEVIKIKTQQYSKPSPLAKFLSSIFTISPLLEAKILFNKKEFNSALIVLEKHFDDFKINAEFLKLLGYVYGELNDYEKMRNTFDAVTKIDNTFKEKADQFCNYYWAVNYNEGVRLFNEANSKINLDDSTLLFGKSLTSFIDSLKCKPHSEESIQNRIMVLINLNRLDEAIICLQDFIRTHNSKLAYTLLGQIYLDKSNKYKNCADNTLSSEFLEMALTILGNGHLLFPDDSEIMLRYSNALIAANKLDIAKDLFKLGVEREPNNKYYHYNYGVTLLNSQNFSEAEVHFKEAIKIDNEYSNAFYNLAATYIKWGIFIREPQQLSEALTDEKINAMNNLAIQPLKRYLELNPTDCTTQDLLEKIYLSLRMNTETNNPS